MSRYILALDQGTTSSRAILFDRSGNIIQMAQQEFTQHYPQPGWVEHNPNELFDSQAVVAAKCLRQAGVTGSEVAAVGIANQRETTVVWNRRTGAPVYNAIVWQDRRTAGFCDSLREQGKAGLFAEKQQIQLLRIDRRFRSHSSRPDLLAISVSGNTELDGKVRRDRNTTARILSTPRYQYAKYAQKHGELRQRLPEKYG